MDSQRQLDTLQIEYGLELYYADNYLYPTKLSELTPAYVKTLPVDPKTHALYPYQLSEDGQSYSICPHFEKLQSGCSTGSSGIHTMNRHQVPPLRLPTSPAY
jgi:hypothetical protein